MKDQETDGEAERQPLVSHYFFFLVNLTISFTLILLVSKKVQLQLTA